MMFSSNDFASRETDHSENLKLLLFEDIIEVRVSGIGKGNEYIGFC